MENSKRRAIGLLMVFATVLTVIATWNLPETGGGRAVVQKIFSGRRGRHCYSRPELQRTQEKIKYTEK